MHHVGYAILAILEVDCSNAGHHHLEILEPYKGREHGAFLGSVQWEQEVSDMWLSIMMLQLTTLTVLFSGKVQNHKMEIFHSSSKLICEQYLMGEVNYFLCNPIKLHSMQD